MKRSNYTAKQILDGKNGELSVSIGPQIFVGADLGVLTDSWTVKSIFRDGVIESVVYVPPSKVRAIETMDSDRLDSGRDR